MNLDRPLYRLWSWRDEIRKVTDLRGRAIGVASRGDTMEGAANLMLRKHGMDPVRDVIWVALGTSGRLTSLISRTVDSAVLGFADSHLLQTRRQPVHEVANIGKEIKMLYTGLATSEELAGQARGCRAAIYPRDGERKGVLEALQDSVSRARKKIRSSAR